ncbi:putative uncharacterized protein DDB_G0282133 [Nylanderia fulva]|uniref:putative uncharacterized protein DDB_G0282133 n=1 Tax=Nylanderia fulva TaxID=613905 RepID=UPI0010FACFFB|nr:putative uncharacterized protein DDB_G0282133 [Nylanderia fulva]
MFILIFAKGRYTVCSKKKKVKKSHIIAVHTNKSVLQEIADNLNKAIPAIELLNISSDVSLTSDTNNTSNDISNMPNSNKSEDICASSNDSNNIEQCTKSDKIGNSLPLFDITHSNDKNPTFSSKNVPTLSSDGSPNKVVNNKIANDNMINDSSFIDTDAILDINTILNIDTLNVNSNIENVCTFFDMEQCSMDDKNDNIRSCDANKIKDLAHLPKDISTIDKNCNKLLNTNNIINDSSLINAAVLPIDTTLNVNASNINSNIDDICSLYDKNDIEQCNICDRNDILYDKNACDIEQCNITDRNDIVYDKNACDIKICNISDKNDINITLCDANIKAIDKIKTIKIISNVEFNNTYKIIDEGNILNKTCVMDNNSLNTMLVDFAPLAESTLTKEKSTSECMSTNANIESDNSLTSERNMDDSFHTSDCSVSEDSDEDELSDNTNHTSINKSKLNKSKLNLTSSLNLSKVNICDDKDMYVETSDNRKLKLSMCPYCKKLQSQFARHLESIHNTEEDVKKFCFLPKGNPERKKIIAIIRRTGNFVYNTDPNVNKGNLIVCRRPAKKLNKQAVDFIPCAKCKGYFSKNNIRHHFKLCTQKTESRQRNVKVLGRTVACRIHYSASTVLRRLVFPVMREDTITQLIRYDELLIAYGNKMCLKYRLQHQHDMIRARLRLLGRFLATMKEIDNTVVDFTSIYNPKRYDYCVKAVNNLAQFDETTWTYKVSSVASSLASSLGAYHKKQVGKFFKEAYQHKKDKKLENQVLIDERTNALKLLQNDGFSIQTWRRLAETTLVSTMMFNRRRAGELERILIEDLKNPAAISKDEAPELQKSLSKYVRVTIRGKLARTVPVLLHEELLSCIQMIVKYRKQASVPVENPYVFGINSTDKRRHKYLRACVLMRKFSVASGAEIPTSLRGTTLRKHIATMCITLDVSDNQEKRHPMKAMKVKKMIT